MTRRVTVREAVATRVSWKDSLARMNFGDKMLVKDRTQAQVGSALAGFNKETQRFVTKSVPNGVQVIRVK